MHHMLGCLFGAVLALIGSVVHEPVVAISGSVTCAGFCLQMVRVMAFSRSRSS